MADKVKLSKDGNSIDFVQSDSIPTSIKKFRQSPEIEGFYRFIFENDLQKETYEILEKIVQVRKAKKLKDKQDAQPAKKIEIAQKKAAEAPPKKMTVHAEKEAQRQKQIPVFKKAVIDPKKNTHSKKK